MYYKQLAICVGYFILFNFIFTYLRVTHPWIGLNIYQYLTEIGYHVENHTIQTQDGYMLTLQRIPCKRNQTICQKNKPPVYFVHGMSGSSIDWTNQGPNRSLALLLADKGYDVWLCNNRGTTWSRRHAELDPDKDTVFWDFSYHEMGVHDLPATIDYILSTTKKDNLTYVGFSQGFTQFLAMAAVRPEYNNKILLACGLAPVTTMYNISAPSIELLKNNYWLFNILDTLDIHNFLENESIFWKFLRCIGYSSSLTLRIVQMIFKYNLGASEQLDQEHFPFYAWNWPAGCSIKQFRHYVQGARTGVFGQYDYQTPMNLNVYNDSTAPTYNLSKVTSRMAIYYSQYDYFVNNLVLDELLTEIPNIVEKYLVPEEDFNHLDFMYNKNITELLYNQVIKTIDVFNMV